ncbi:cholesterol 7-desaturase-like [Centruroides sculpturatus]|uniref:cholesterol 7-desaturase-like n=1 Tax=Centruroides sculpturatus TaxID=218467 RepID=UPI000C6E1614|nr:cholesterol 7-desaturase-like [Centruroides sculpturatus]
MCLDITDIGYEDGKMNARELRKKRFQLIKDTNRSRRTNEFPPAYPNGWIPLLESRDLPVGKCIPVTALGQQFVIFRGKTGKCFVLDAYCPHLGAHLGTDGKVHEDCIECPFHGWRFAGQDGYCVKIPYAEKKVAKIKSWETIEENGFIYVWHHAEGQPPLWKPPVIPEIKNRLMIYKGRSEHILNCHIQVLLMNSAFSTWFYQFFEVVYNMIPEGQVRVRLIRQYYTSSRFTGIRDYVICFFESYMLERDIQIWNYKMYLKNPVYVSKEKAIAKYRKWYSQFYSENSPRVEENNLSW